MEADCHKSNVKQLSFTSQNSKTHAPFRLCFVTLRSDYNLEVSFNFHLTFKLLKVIKTFTVQ